MVIMKRCLMVAVISSVFFVCANAQEKAAAAPAKSAPAVKAATTTTAPASVKATAPAGDTLVIKARLVEIAGKLPPNDLYNYVYIMKYKVLGVEKGKYDGEEILVGHYNPLIPRKQLKDKMAAFIKGDVEKFEVGQKHHLYLITPVTKVWKDAMEDDYIDSELDKYIAVKVETSK